MQVDKARLDEMAMPDNWPQVLRDRADACYVGDSEGTRDLLYRTADYVEAAALRSTEGKEGAKTVAYLIDCPVEPCLEFADVDVPDAAIPLVRRSDLAAAEASHKAARENFLTMQGSAAQLLSRAEAAEAHVAKLEALQSKGDVISWQSKVGKFGYWCDEPQGFDLNYRTNSEALGVQWRALYASPSIPEHGEGLLRVVIGDVTGDTVDVQPVGSDDWLNVPVSALRAALTRSPE